MTVWRGLCKKDSNSKGWKEKGSGLKRDCGKKWLVNEKQESWTLWKL